MPSSSNISHAVQSNQVRESKFYAPNVGPLLSVHNDSAVRRCSATPESIGKRSAIRHAVPALPELRAPITKRVSACIDVPGCWSPAGCRAAAKRIMQGDGLGDGLGQERVLVVMLSIINSFALSPRCCPHPAAEGLDVPGGFGGFGVTLAYSATSNKAEPGERAMAPPGSRPLYSAKLNYSSGGTRREE